MSVDSASIMAKVEEFAKSERGKKMIDEKLAEYMKKGKKKTNAGSVIISEAVMEQCAKDLIKLLTSKARSHASMSGNGDGIPPSVLAHFSSLTYSKPIRVNDNTFKIIIQFTDDLSRPSLDPGMYGGINNIVALFNNGYRARESIYGWWDSHSKYTWSRTNREGLRFMQDAMAEFNSSYGPKYNTTAELSGEYGG